MYSFLFKLLFISSATFLFSYIFSKCAYILKLIDYPDVRKLHTGEVPQVGGIAIYLTLLIFIPFSNLDYWLNLVILSSFIIVVVGSIDDAYDLGVIIRLVSQLIVSLIIIGGGLQIVNIGIYDYFPFYSLGMFGTLLTVICVLGLTNAVNFIDGIDGLSSGLVLIALISLYYFSLNDGGLFNENIILLFSISVLIFFLINNNFLLINKIFLGDSGSTMLGFILAWLLIYYSHPSIGSIHPALTMWCVTVPVYDMFGVILRRILHKKNPFRPDRRHIHHIFVDRGFNSNFVLIIILIYAILSNILGFTIYSLFGPDISLIFFIFWFLIYLIAIRIFLKNFKLKN